MQLMLGTVWKWRQGWAGSCRERRAESSSEFSGLRSTNERVFIQAHRIETTSVGTRLKTADADYLCPTHPGAEMDEATEKVSDEYAANSGQETYINFKRKIFKLWTHRAIYWHSDLPFRGCRGTAAEECLMLSRLLAVFVLATWVVPALCQQPSAGPSVVQPGAPGQSNKTVVSPSASASLHEPSEADTKFMQGMILHHSQAVEMVALLKTRGSSKEVQALGERIRISQTDEMKFMKQWLEDRGKAVPSEHDMMMHSMGQMDMSHMDHDMGGMSMPLMPGMLTPAQMKTLAAASGPEFDHLFLTGMIQHHTGALTMVKDLFATQGAGQDPQLFDFAMDVDNTQQAEIDIMRSLLSKEKQ